MTTISMTAELLELVEELSQIRDEKKDLTKREKQLREALLEALGEAEHGQSHGRVIITRQVQHRTGVDRGKLEAMYPDVFQDVRTESEATTLVIGDADDIDHARFETDRMSGNSPFR